MTIIGRNKEIKFLETLLYSEVAEFAAVYGRRRVGKTYLIQQYFQDKGIFFELTGRKDAPLKMQLKNFASVFRDTFGDSSEKAIATWDDAFEMLHKKMEELQSQKEKIILFFDELPWLSGRKSGFLQALDLFWNRYFSRNSQCLLIVCGSAAEWMIKKVIANKGGLHNRLTKPALCLKPFNLTETQMYLEARHIRLERKQIVELYMALGGVAYYLNLVPAGKSVAEILQILFFSKLAPMRMEFQQLFSSLFNHSQIHIQVIKVLAKVQQGMTQGEITDTIPHLSSGGGMVTILEELEHCGFIFKLVAFGKKKKEARYRLIDAFSLFYLKWVEGLGEVSAQYWLRKMGSGTYTVWAGYAFENLCFQHYEKIIQALEISVVAEAKSGWIVKGYQETLGAQIDLVIDRSDKCINLCEIKFYDDEFSVAKDYAVILRRKKTLFREHTQTRKTLFTTLITTYGVIKNAAYLDCVDQQLTMDALF